MWKNIKSILSDKLPETAFSLWVEPLQCVRENDQEIELAGPDRFFCAWVSDNYLTDIRDALDFLDKPGIQVCFSVGKDNTPCLPILPKKEQLRLPNIPERRSNVRTLHPRYTFDEFMVGDSNALAHSACEAIAHDDTVLSPCLYIDAGTGLGKSHLTHAVGHYIMNNGPGVRLHYMTAQQFTGEVVRNIQGKTMDKFKEKYHNHCDVLLLEDVQSLAGRTKTQEELAEVLDVLMERGKKIIFTGSVSPREIKNIEAGFRSRLSSGLITSINPPDQRTRKLIIERKAKNNDLPLSEDLVMYLAESVKGDIRRVESAIIGLKAKACLFNTAPDLDMVKEIIASIVGHSQELTVEMIRDFVAGQFKISVHDLQSKSRKKTIAFPRQVSMYLARKFTEEPLSEIGRAFNRDHSTVVHSVRVINETIARNGSVRGQIDHLSKKLKQRLY